MLLSEDYLKNISEKFVDYKERYEVRKLTIEDIAKIKNGKDWKTLGSGNTPVYGSGGKMDVYVNKHSYNKPTVLIPRKGSIENIFYVDEPFWNVDTIYYTEIDETKIKPKYFYYFMKTIDLKSLSTNSTRPSLTQSILNKIKINVPTIEIQNKVVEVLDKFQDLLSDTQGLLPEEIEQRQKQYEYYREKLLTFDENMLERERERERERGYLSNSYLESLKEAGEIVGVSIFNIKKKNLGEVSDIVLGGTPNKTKHEYWENGTIPWMSSGEVNKKKIYSTDNFITQAGYDNSSATMVPANSTVIALAGQGKTRGLVARIKISLSTNQSLATLIPKDIIINDYMYYYLESQYNKLREVSSGDGSRGGLNKEILKRYPIVIPPIPIQEQVVSILDKFDRLVNDINEGLPKEIELRQKQYEYYRERLLNFPK